MSGRWYYFPVAMAVKTPLATLVGLVISTAYWAIRRASFPRFWDCLALSLFPIIYMATAMTSDLNLGIRHVLPVYPFLFIFLGLTAADGLRRFRRLATAVVSVLLLGLVLETATAYPDYIPFFNIAAGGWKNGPRFLGDSNVDWGQDLPAIAEWQRQNPQYQLFLNYFGSADPRYYQVHYVNLPGSTAPDDETPIDSLPASTPSAATHFTIPGFHLRPGFLRPTAKPRTDRRSWPLHLSVQSALKDDFFRNEIRRGLQPTECFRRHSLRPVSNSVHRHLLSPCQ